MGKKKRRHEKVKKDEEQLFESDEFHYFIVGYTSGGASYGVTWEQAEEEGLIGEIEKPVSYDDDLPF